MRPVRVTAHHRRPDARQLRAVPAWRRLRLRTLCLGTRACTETADCVLQAAYVGVPDPVWGERPLGIIKLVPGATEREEDILKFLRAEGVEKGKITKWMLPDFMLITDDIPKTSVGKYDKIAIKKRLDEFQAKARRVRDM